LSEIESNIHINSPSLKEKNLVMSYLEENLYNQKIKQGEKKKKVLFGVGTLSLIM